jgi:hypothetical protein
MDKKTESIKNVADKLEKTIQAYEDYLKARESMRTINKDNAKVLARLYAAKYRAEHLEKYAEHDKRRVIEMHPGYLRTKLKRIGVSHEETRKHPELLEIMREHLIAYRNRDSSWNRKKQKELLLSKIHKVLSKNSSYEKSNKKA